MGGPRVSTVSGVCGPTSKPLPAHRPGVRLRQATHPFRVVSAFHLLNGMAIIKASFSQL